MRALSSADFLDLWERGSSLHPVDQGLLALQAAFPEVPYQTLADWPLGRRNQALTELRSAYFGPSLEGWLACAQCGEKLEFEIDSRASLTNVSQQERQRYEPIDFRGHTFRLPSSRDLALAARETDPETAARHLLTACHLGENQASEWSEEDLEAVGQALALADPMAETTLALSCPACLHEWEEAIDITTFLWAEVEATAKRLLLEVHRIASAYGWSEREILSLSETRRAFYLEMVQA